MKELEAFVRQYLIDNNIPLESARKKKSVVDLIVYGSRKSDWDNKVATNFYNKYLPDRINSSKRQEILTYIYIKTQKRMCTLCKNILDFSEFYPDPSRSTGIGSECKKCQIERTREWQRANPERAVEIRNRNSRKHCAKRRAAQLNRTPPWVDLEKISVIYQNCPEGYQVDHIIPLQGKLVSGLHVHENLQYLTPSENSSKGNRYNEQP